MRWRSCVVLLGFVVVAVMTGQLRPTNVDSFTHPDPRLARVLFQVDPRMTTTTTSLP